MKLQVQSIHFDADQGLLDYIQAKCDKLDHFFDKIVDGEEGLNYYSNLGRDHWGLMMDDFMYHGVDMTDQTGAKIAIIDSANVTIQLPELVFDNLLQEVKAKAAETDPDGAVRFYALTNFDGSITMEVNQPCEVAVKKLRNISFKLEKTKVTIKPEGYTYQMSAAQKRC